MRIIIFILIVYACAHVPDSRKEITKFSSMEMNKQIKPFVSDGCSVWPEGSKLDKTAWLRCCIVHDIAYWKGGTEQEKEKSDEALRECVEKNSSEIIGDLMKFGVAIGGSPLYKTPFKWGFGWTYDRGYLKLSSKERSYLQKIAPKKGEDLRLYLNREKIDPEINSINQIVY